MPTYVLINSNITIGKIPVKFSEEVVVRRSSHLVLISGDLTNFHKDATFNKTPLSPGIFPNSANTSK